MASVTGFTAERMLEIENNTVVSGVVVGDDLILTKHDGTDLNAGNVRGPIGSPGVTEEQLNDSLAALDVTFAALEADIEVAATNAVPVGTIVDYIGVAAPTKWLMMQGQTIVNGQSLHPDLWAILPTSMKSGSNILMPDTRGRVTVGHNSADASFDAIGETGGAKTHTLSQSEMPVHSHVITVESHRHTNDHVHGTVYSQGESAGHTHGFSATTTTESNTHTHPSATGTPFALAESVTGAGNIPSPISVAVTNVHVAAQTGFSNTLHTHNVAGTTTGASTSHIHGVDIPAYSGYTGYTQPSASATNAGSGAAHNNLQPYIVFSKIIKVV